MPSAILDSKIQKALLEGRWFFLSTRLHAIVFLFVSSFFFVLLFVLYFSDATQIILNQYVYPKRNPIELLSQAKEFENDAIHVLLLGGSTSRELTGENKSISKRITEVCGKPVRFINAGSSSQTYVAARALYAEYQRQNVDLVVIGMNYYKLIVNPMSLKTDIINNGQIVPTPFGLFVEEIESAQDLPVIEPLYFGAKLHYYVKEVGKVNLKNIVGAQASSEFIAPHNYYRAPAKTLLEKKEIVRRFLLIRFPDYLEYSEAGIQRWINFAENALSNGSDVLFLGLPLDNSMVEIDRYFSPQFDSFLQQAKEKGVLIEDWRKKNLNLISDDYFDQQHLLASGRKKVVNPLVDLIASHLSECNV